MKRCYTVILFLAFINSASASVLPPYVIEWPQSLEHILVADASRSTLTQYSRTDEGIEQRSFYMSVGERGIGKQRDGDRRTPLGVYFVTEELDTFHLDPIYGAAALPVDYPNARDRMLGRDGGGIWLHGVAPDGGRRPARDTDGCLALPNDAIVSLAEEIEIQETPVIITRVETPLSNVDTLRTEIRARLEHWMRAKRKGYSTRLDALYAQDFEQWGLDRTAWLALWSTRGVTDWEMEDVFIAKDPEEPNLFVTRFRLVSGVSTRYKRLYWKRDPERRLVIVAEDGW